MAVNTNLCQHRFIRVGDRTQMLQAASLFFQSISGRPQVMAEILLEVALTSIDVLGFELDGIEV